MMKKNVLWMMSMLLLLAVGAVSCSNDDIDYYTAKVLSCENDNAYASIISAPTDSHKNRQPGDNDRIIFSKSDLPGQIYQEGGMVSFRIKEAHILEGYYHDQLYLYWECVVEPIK